MNVVISGSSNRMSKIDRLQKYADRNEQKEKTEFPGILLEYQQQ